MWVWRSRSSLRGFCFGAVVPWFLATFYRVCVLGVDAAHSRGLPSEDYGNTQHPLASTGTRIALAHPFDSGCAIIE